MAEEPRPGLIVGGRYELLEVAGRGGMADVWRGRVRGDSGFVRDVAIKQMHANLAIQPQYVAMFVEEARVGSALQSPNVSEVHDFVHDRGHYYMILEWIDGDRPRQLDQVARRAQRADPLGAGRRGRRSASCAASPRRTSGSGPTAGPLPIVHRDVSPHNVLLTTRGMVKLIDFGLALAPDRPQETTEPGIVKGKMSYLAPEIVDRRAPEPGVGSVRVRLGAVGGARRPQAVRRRDRLRDLLPAARLHGAAAAPAAARRAGGVRADHPSRAVAGDADSRFPSTREMARQIGTALKKVQLRKDLHTVLRARP